MVGAAGIEPGTGDYEILVLPLHYPALLFIAIVTHNKYLMKCSIQLDTYGYSHDVVLQIIVDNTVINSVQFDNLPHQFEFELDTNTTHCIQLTMTGKTSNHTKIDVDGNILSDVHAIVKSITFDQIEVVELFCRGKCCYKHNNNGATQPILDQFYGFIGCNGTVSIDCYPPIHQWLVEHAYQPLVH